MARIFIIGDDPQIGQTLQQLIAGLGHSCDTAPSSIDIDHRLAVQEYNLIFCNTHLKEGSGFNWAKSILQRHPHLKIVLVINKHTPGIVIELLKLGVMDFISLPINSVRIEWILASLLGEGKAGEKINQLEQQLESAQEQIIKAEKMASVGQLAAGVAHEINNPVGFVASNLNTLQHYQRSLFALITQYRNFFREVTEERPHRALTALIVKRSARIMRLQAIYDVNYLCRDALALIRESNVGITRVKKIVQDLKIFIHPGQEYSQYADIHTHLDATLTLVANKTKYQIKIEKMYGAIPQVFCRISQLNQVFLNLIVNAIQAIEEKGTIFIATKTYDQNWIEISIRDTGQGIPDDHLTKIFDPFFTTKPAGLGTGLGLHMSRGIIQEHQGTLTVASKLGHGSTFTIRLPITSETVGEVEQMLQRR